MFRKIKITLAILTAFGLMATPALVSAAATTTDTIQNEVACGTSQQTFSSSDCTASVTT